MYPYRTDLTDNNPNIPDTIETENIPYQEVYVQQREGGFGQDYVNVPMLIDGDGKQAVEIHINNDGLLSMWVGRNKERDDEGNLFGAHTEEIVLSYEQLKELTDKAYLELVRRGFEKLPFENK